VFILLDDVGPNSSTLFRFIQVDPYPTIWKLNDAKSPEPEALLLCETRTPFMFCIVPSLLSMGEAVNKVCPTELRNEPSE
jgi:hypothetical protein